MLNKIKSLLLKYLNSNSVLGKGVRVVTKAFTSALVLGLVGLLSSVHGWAPNDLKNAFVGLVIAAGAAALHVGEDYARKSLTSKVDVPAPPVAPKP